PDAQLDELARDMETHGQRDPVEILDNGVIVDGHQRRRAALRLGWNELDVIVREDLAEAEDSAVEAEMIAANLHRRQLDVLAIARLYARLRQIARGWDSDDFVGEVKRDVRDRLAGRLGHRSGRTLDRYVKLLETPREVQDAVSRQELSMGAAIKVAKLSEDDRATIAAAIRQGQPAKEVIAAFFNARRSRPANPETQEFLAALASTVSEPSEAATPAAGNDEDLGALQDPVSNLEAVIDELIRAELPDERKIVALTEASACLEALLDSP
ncbi:MAG: ParB N-terminal domain-containing protein, partial [Thermoguttaceae bacterium]